MDAVEREPIRSDTGTPLTTRLPLGLLAGLLLALLAGLFAGYGLASRATPGPDSADAGFARDMIEHHRQAVEMSKLLYDRTEDELMQTLAYDILTMQQAQIGIMTGWLESWGLPTNSRGPRMAWMGMPVTGLMPGMATGEQMDALAAARGDEADIIFMQLMIPHHQSGVEMALAAAEQAGNDVVRRMAVILAEGQLYEIDYMQEMLLAKGAAPVPDAAPHAGHE